MDRTSCSSLKFTWRINKFSSLNTKKHYSEVFTFGSYKWRVLVFPKGNNIDYLSVYLGVPDSATLPKGWGRHADFSFTVVNQINAKKSIKKDTRHQLNACESDWGFTSFMPLNDLLDPTKGYISNDTIVVEAQVFCMPESVPSQGVELEKDARIGDNVTKDPVLEPQITAPCEEQDQDIAKTDPIDSIVPDSVHSQQELEKCVRNVFNQDELNDKDMEICFDEMTTTLLEKLEDNKAPHSVRISDFNEFGSNNYVDVGIFIVPESLESYAKDLLATDADIGTGNSSVHYMNEMAFVVLCCALKSMDTTCFSEITESLILKWRDAIRGALQFGFKVDFLKDHLKSVTETYLARLARNSHESQELQATDDKITTMEKQLDTLKARRSEMYNKMYTELRKT